MNYATQMEAAKKGIVTEALLAVAQKEGIEVDQLQSLVAQGKVVIPANKNHKSLSYHGVGNGLRTKINVNLGVSEDCCNIKTELEKVDMAIEMKAEAIMDLSCYGKTQQFRKLLIERSSAMIGTVPMYDAVGMHEKDLKELTAKDLLNVVRKHAIDGVDFMTIHAGMNRATAAKVKNNPRLTGVVSRGGSLLFAWMEMTGNENPFFEYYDELLEICREYDVTLSLGDACRPGSVADATDASQVQELITLGELTKRAWEKDVQVMIEGPGHMMLNEITANVIFEKKLCHGAPFYVLGPLVTDVAPGYDHITSAIGGAIAAAAGADFLCYVTPAEHLRLPSLDDVREGIIAAKIAAHAGDLAKNVSGAKEWDHKMSSARAKLDFSEMIHLALDSKKPQSYREQSEPIHKDTCTMCGKMCAVKNMQKILQGENICLK